MSYSLGIDVGTTFSAAAVAPSVGRVELVILSGRAPSIPSVIAARPDGEVLVGDAAEARAATDPTRVAREFKRRLGDPTPLILGGTPFPAETLTMILIRHIVELVARRMGGPAGAVVITHPASYTAYRLDLLRNAAVEAGVRSPILRSEPHAAAAQYEAGGRVNPNEIVAVYDFGGGTFDFALLQHRGGGFELMDVPVGVDRLGGIDFDHAILQYVGESLGGVFDTLDLTDHGTMSLLAKLRRDVREAKETLSEDTDTTIAVVIPGVHAQVRLSRSEFEGLIRPRLGETFVALRRATDAAGIALADIDRILLVGGSSRIPLIREQVRLRTERPIAEDIDPGYAVALGAAQLASRAGALASPVAAPVAEPVRFCTRCGTARPAGRSFCAKCGSRYAR